MESGINFISLSGTQKAKEFFSAYTKAARNIKHISKLPKPEQAKAEEALVAATRQLEKIHSFFEK